MGWFSNLIGAKERDKAIDVVEASANPEWKEEALAVVEKLARRSESLTTDAVWALMTTKTTEPRAMGAIMRTATKLGYIEPTDYHIPSIRRASHRRPIRVWKSLIKESA
jgi:hypothetical protein